MTEKPHAPPTAPVLRRAIRAVYALGVVMVLVQAGMITLAWQALPETIGIHFTLDGDVTRLGRKAALWSLPCISSAILVLSMLLGRSRQLNLPWEIDERSRESQLLLAHLFIAALHVFFVMALSYLNGAVIWANLNGSPLPVGLGLALTVTLVPAAMLVLYLRLAKRLRS
jgi:uncharacterized membrane protein